MDKNKDIINLIKDREIDGENMQYILEQVGMDYQMYKQLNVKYNTSTEEQCYDRPDWDNMPNEVYG